MSMFAKIMVVVNLILAVMFLAVAGTLLGAAEDYKKKYTDRDAAAVAEKNDLALQITAADNKQKQTQDRYNEADKGQKSAEGQLKQLEASNTALQGANAQLRAALDKLASAQSDLNSRLTDLNKQNDALRGDLSTSEAARKASDDKNRAQADEIARLAQDKDTAERALAAAETASKTANDDLDTAKTTLKRYHDEFGALRGGVTMADVKGVVQAVDNKVDIYVISVGSKDKVEVGYEFTVFRGSNYVSTIVIDKVFPNYASGTTKAGTKKMDVMAGDECATRL